MAIVSKEMRAGNESYEKLIEYQNARDNYYSSLKELVDLSEQMAENELSEEDVWALLPAFSFVSFATKEMNYLERTDARVDMMMSNFIEPTGNNKSTSGSGLSITVIALLAVGLLITGAAILIVSRVRKGQKII